MTTKPRFNQKWLQIVIPVFLVAVIAGILASVSNHSTHNGHAAPLSPVRASNDSGVPVPTYGAYFGGTNNDDPVNGFTACNGKSAIPLLECKMQQEGQPSNYQFASIRLYMPGNNACSTAEPSLRVGGDLYKLAKQGGGRQIVVLSLKCDTWASFAGGSGDGNIKKVVDDVAAWNVPTLLVFHHEPDDDSCGHDPSQMYFGTPDEYRAASRHFSDIVRADAAADHTNKIGIGWIIMGAAYRILNNQKDPKNAPAYPGGSCGTLTKQDIRVRNPNNWYPGDDAVDWALVDAYNDTGNDANNPTQSFSSIMTPFLNWANNFGSSKELSNEPTGNYTFNLNHRLSMPLGIGEYSTNGHADYRASWYTAMQQQVAVAPNNRIKDYNIWSAQDSPHNVKPPYQVDYPRATDDPDHPQLGHDDGTHQVLRAFTNLSKIDYFTKLRFGTGPTDNPPTVSFTSPGNGATVGGIATISANASDDHSVTSIKLYVGSATTPIKTAAPSAASGSITTQWDTTKQPNGNITLSAVVTDSANPVHTVTVTRTVNIYNGPGTNDQPPNITLTKPTNNANFNGVGSVVVSYTANATDDKGLANILFKLDTTNLGTTAISGLSATASYNWTAGINDNGQHLAVAVATDNHSQSKASAAAVINVQVTAPPNAPSPPSQITSTAQTTSSITLSWHAATDPDDPASNLVYHVIRDGFPAGTTAKGVTSFTDNGMPPGTTHSYQIYTVDPAGHNSANSAAFIAKTKSLNCSKAAAPANLRVTSATTTSITVSWNAVSLVAPCSIGHYIVQNNGTSVGNVTGTSYTLSGLVASASYTVGVLAVANDSTPGYTSTVKGTTAKATDSTPPTAPQNVVALPVSQTQINLSWDAATDTESGIKQYHVMRDGKEIARTTTTSYGDSGLQAGTAYKYVVVAENGATPSLSTPSAPASATTLSQPDSNNGSGNTGGTVDIPLLSDTTSVGTGDDTGNTADQHAYNQTSSQVSDNPGATVTTPTTAHKPVATRSSVPLGLRLIAGIGGLALLVGVPVAAGYILRRVPTGLSAASQPAATVIGPEPPDQTKQP